MSNSANTTIVIQTPLSKRKGQPDKEEKENNDSHGTCAASKAVGQNYGTAKGATLVVVKMYSYSLVETGEVFDLVYQDIMAHPERKGKCIVTISMSSGDVVDPNNIKWVEQKQERDHIKKLLDNDVIVVASAGNHATGNKDKTGKPLPDRPNIDTSPGVFEGKDFPIIMVGATDFDGKPLSYSQAGDHLTILAPGLQIRCQSQDPKRKIPKFGSGTSFGKSNHCSLRSVARWAADISGLVEEIMCFPSRGYQAHPQGFFRMLCLGEKFLCLGKLFD